MGVLLTIAAIAISGCGRGRRRAAVAGPRCRLGPAGAGRSRCTRSSRSSSSSIWPAPRSTPTWRGARDRLGGDPARRRARLARRRSPARARPARHRLADRRHAGAELRLPRLSAGRLAARLPRPRQGGRLRHRRGGPVPAAARLRDRSGFRDQGRRGLPQAAGRVLHPEPAAVRGDRRPARPRHARPRDAGRRLARNGDRAAADRLLRGRRGARRGGGARGTSTSARRSTRRSRRRSCFAC